MEPSPARKPLQCCCGCPANKLDAQELLQIIEGIDPVAVVIASASSAQAFFAAYHLQPIGNERFTALCREVRSIPCFEELMESPDGRQRIWAVLKTLPRP